MYGVMYMHLKAKDIVKFVIILVLITLIAYNLFCSYVSMMRTVHSVAQSQMEEVANMAIHTAISDASSNSAVYGELVNIYRNENGTIESLTLNPYAANKLKSDISLKVLEYLNDSDKYVIEVPVGNFFGSEFLTGVGPKVRLQVIPFDIVAIDFDSSFTPAGINQVLHRVEVTAEVKIGAILPGYEGISNVSSSAIVSEAVIIGDVPDTYLNIEKSN